MIKAVRARRPATLASTFRAIATARGSHLIYLDDATGKTLRRRLFATSCRVVVTAPSSEASASCRAAVQRPDHC
jgi:hypothetical protein